MKIVQFGGGYVHKDDVPNYEDDEGTPSPDLVHRPTNVGSSSNVATRSSTSLEDHILGLNQRLQDFFLLSTSHHEEVLKSIGEVNTRISNLETKFDAFTHDVDDMSEEF
ncbi:hypothetical protein DEO72_LG4g1412 [Vigna unguiculata]|uniref:Uncharacterized protein n=1 Tax=Vigna unguiculata TaxID=3917 RepID=A0A4D6LQS9_VIGUN|nr:hypothetical protein DEO72_LG4g1412 [Vigna unguiculata]